MEKIIKVEPNYELPQFKNISADCMTFLKKLLTKNPENRPSAYEAYKHDWIQKYVEKTSLGVKSKTQTL